MLGYIVIFVGAIWDDFFNVLISLIVECYEKKYSLRRNCYVIFQHNVLSLIIRYKVRLQSGKKSTPPSQYG